MFILLLIFVYTINKTLLFWINTAEADNYLACKGDTSGESFICYGFASWTKLNSLIDSNVSMANSTFISIKPRESPVLTRELDLDKLIAKFKISADSTLGIFSLGAYVLSFARLQGLSIFPWRETKLTSQVSALGKMIELSV